MVGIAEVREVGAEVAALARSLGPDAVPLPDALPMWEAFDTIERQAAAAKLLLTARVDESRAAQRTGHRDTAELLAKKAGTSTGAARRQLDTARKLRDLPATGDALRKGELSPGQAEIVAGAAVANRSAEDALIDRAKTASFAELRDEALRARAHGEDREATHRRIHAARRLRTWTDAEGAWNLSARGTVVDGATVMRALNPLVDNLFGEARRDGRHDEHETHAFDALVALAERREESTTKPPSPKYLALLRADCEALCRGEVHDGELCEITGLGPIPATTARELLGDAILELVITKGVDVLHVTHLGRGPTAAQRVALLWSSPGCSVEGCPRTRIEIDHREPYAKTRHTKLEELDPFCGLHHHQKHHHGWSLVEGTGKRAFVPPDDPRHPKNRPKRE
jgi:uncharacterized protein DUF222